MEDFEAKLAAAQAADMGGAEPTEAQGDDLPPIDDNKQDELPPLEGEDGATTAPEEGEGYNQDADDSEQKQEDDKGKGGDDDDDDFYTVDEKGMVPHSRLKKEITKRREYEERQRQLENDYVRTQTELENFKKALEIYNQEENDGKEDEVNTDYDPIDSDADRAYKAQLAAMKAEIDALKGNTAESSKAVAIQAFSSTVQSQQDAFEREHPDFTNAFQHIGSIEYNKALRLTGDAAKAQEEAGKALTKIAAGFYTNGKNVASEFYDLAKDYGYQGSAEAQKAKGVDLDAIERNSKKSVGVRSLPGAAATPATVNPDLYFTKENVDKIKTHPGGPTDPKKFVKILQRINGN